LPDTDGDGIPDPQDACPNEGDAGYGLDTNGCPLTPPDSDNDGIPDPQDDCPNEGDAGYGLDANGCPLPPPQPAGVDLNTIPYITPLEGDVLATTQTLHAQGLNMSPPVNSGAFSVVGEVPPAQFLGDLADGAADFDALPDAEALTALVQSYAAAPLPTGGNSFDTGGALASSADWLIGDLLDPARADPSCGGDAPLECELRTNRPAVVFVVVGRNDILAGTPTEQFAATLRAVTEQITASGAIPVLMSIPGDPALYPALDTYNAAIVGVAQEQQVPLVNVWRAINDNAPASGVGADLALSSSGTGDIFNAEELGSYGVPNRNLWALRVLQQLYATGVLP
jgi:hypothetical protein